MNSTFATTPRPSPAVRAEAALWLAHLRGPERNADVEQGFRLWLEAKPEHAAAFEMANEVWERSAGIRRRPYERVMSCARSAQGRNPRLLAVAAALAAVVGLGTAWYLHRDAVSTTVGEQRTLTLRDGTRIFLNTDTRAVVQYNAEERRVRLDRGEALFEVAKSLTRPFIVEAGTAQIEALGTSFVVRRDSQQLAVTLVEGKVAVAPVASSESKPPLRQVKTLKPGERLTIAMRRAPTVDRPVLDKVTAWQRGQVVFDNTRLADAVAEMNRYSVTKLVIERPETAAIFVGGIFRAGDVISFAQAMAETYRLQVIEESGKIVFAGTAGAPELSDRPPAFINTR